VADTHHLDRLPQEIGRELVPPLSAHPVGTSGGSAAAVTMEGAALLQLELTMKPPADCVAARTRHQKPLRAARCAYAHEVDVPVIVRSSHTDATELRQSFPNAYVTNAAGTEGWREAVLGPGTKQRRAHSLS
jgi:hypothetical protein